MAVKRYNGTSWDTVAGLGAQGAAATSSSITTWVKTASGGETSLTGSSDSSTTLAYTPGQEQFFINGVLQVRGSDYTATNGTSITGITALVAGDIATVTSVNAFSVTGAVPLSTVTANGDLIVGTSSGAVGRLGVGSTGQVLSVSGGAPAWATPSSSDFVLIKAATTFTNVANTGTTFDSLFTTTYNAYLVVVEYIHAVTGTHDLYWQFRRGTTTQTTGYYYNSIGAVYTGAGVTNTGAANDTKFQLTTTMSDSAATGLTGTINITSTGGTARYPGVNGILTEDGTASMYVFAGNQSNNYDYTGFILSSSSSNISGKISVYGVKA
jgi:Tfp pilus assembly protein PilV